MNPGGGMPKVGIGGPGGITGMPGGGMKPGGGPPGNPDIGGIGNPAGKEGGPRSPGFCNISFKSLKTIKPMNGHIPEL